MQIEDYFDFLGEDDIRLKGSRIGIESLLYEYIHRGQTAEAIAQQFPSLSLEQVYATILYYLRNREQLDDYVADWLDYCRRTEEEQDRNPPPVVDKLRKLRAEKQSRETAA